MKICWNFGKSKKIYGCKYISEDFWRTPELYYSMCVLFLISCVSLRVRERAASELTLSVWRNHACCKRRSTILLWPPLTSFEHQKLTCCNLRAWCQSPVQRTVAYYAARAGTAYIRNIPRLSQYTSMHNLVILLSDSCNNNHTDLHITLRYHALHKTPLVSQSFAKPFRVET